MKIPAWCSVMSSVPWEVLHVFPKELSAFKESSVEMKRTKTVYCTEYICLSSARCIHGYRRHTAGGQPSGGLASQPGGSSNTTRQLYAKETGISSGSLGLWLVCAFTFTFTLLIRIRFGLRNVRRLNQALNILGRAIKPCGPCGFEASFKR